ncbi:unnamed protein product, partial [Pocillopora meandrina]
RGKGWFYRWRRRWKKIRRVRLTCRIRGRRRRVRRRRRKWLVRVKRRWRRFIRVRLESQGFVDKKRGRTLLGRSRAYIRVNGRDYSPHRRGFNVVLVNRRTGRVFRRQSFDTHGSRYQAKKFKKFIYGIKSGTIVLVAIQDEAYRYGRYYKYVFRRLKIHPRRIRLGYRSSLALIGYVGGHRPSWLRYMSRRQKRGPSSVVSRIPLGRGMRRRRRLRRIRRRRRRLLRRIRRQGFVDKVRGRTLYGRSRAYIRVNGRDYSLHRRGFNVVLVSRRTGRVFRRVSFDTHGSRNQAKRFKNFIYRIRSGTIVLVAVQDEAYRYGRYYKYVFKRLQMLPRRIKLSYRGSLAVIGYVGRVRQRWLRYRFRPQKRGPSSVVSRIP